MKEELLTLLIKFNKSKSEKNYSDLYNAIIKYEKMLSRLNCDAQHWFEMCIELSKNKKNEINNIREKLGIKDDRN